MSSVRNYVTLINLGLARWWLMILDAVWESGRMERSPRKCTTFSRSMEMTGLTRDGTAKEPVLRDQILWNNFSVQLTTSSRIGSHIRLIHTFLNVMGHTRIMYSIL